MLLVDTCRVTCHLYNLAATPRNVAVIHSHRSIYMAILVPQAEMISAFVESALYGMCLLDYCTECTRNMTIECRILCLLIRSHCLGARVSSFDYQSESTNVHHCFCLIHPKHDGLCAPLPNSDHNLLAFSSYHFFLQRWIVDIKLVYDAFLRSTDPALYLQDTARLTWKNALFVCQTILGDGVVVCFAPGSVRILRSSSNLKIYRTYIVWQSFYAIIAPCLCYLAMVGE